MSRPLEFLGGSDTPRSSISGGVLALNQVPYEYQELHADAVLKRLENAQSSFDQRMNSCTLAFEAPTTSGNEVKCAGRRRTPSAGCPNEAPDA